MSSRKLLCRDSIGMWVSGMYVLSYIWPSDSTCNFRIIVLLYFIFLIKFSIFLNYNLFTTGPEGRMFPTSGLDSRGKSVTYTIPGQPK